MMVHSSCDVRKRLRLESIFLFELVDSVAHIVRDVRGSSAMGAAETVEQSHRIIIYPISCQRKRQSWKNYRLGQLLNEKEG